jgi:hypothetical protein
MEKKLKQGTMVRLIDTPTRRRDTFGTSIIAAKHGWLWIVEEVRGTDMYLCKSIATGALHNIYSEEICDATQDSNVG